MRNGRQWPVECIADEQSFRAERWGDGTGMGVERDGEQRGPGMTPDGSVAPAAFVEREPPPALGDRVPHVEAIWLPRDGWVIAGLSRRGLSHAHEGRFREDAMDARATNGWQLAAVADGAGAYPLARVGANRAVRAAVTAMEATVTAADPGSSEDAGAEARAALLAGLRAAYDDTRAEAARRGVPAADLRTTLLLLVHRALPGGVQLFAGAQIGDGAVVVRDAAGALHRLGAPDTGATGNESLFLTDVEPAAWPGRVRALRLAGVPCYALALTDGVADDFAPAEEHLARLERPLVGAVLAAREGEAVTRGLAELLAYERAGSFDDRTLVCIYEMGSGPWT